MLANEDAVCAKLKALCPSVVIMGIVEYSHVTLPLSLAQKIITTTLQTFTIHRII
eukprot:SAG31_NODE_28161_length_414_cov_1.466667_1_plen_54_part_01